MSAAAETKGNIWGEAEVKVLLGVWGEEAVQQQLEGAVRNKVIYEGVAKELRKLGYIQDWEQCRNKIKNLKKQYRTTKDHNDETGRGRKICKFYEELDDILGHRPASAPAVLLDSLSSQDETELSPGSAQLDTNG